MGSTVKLGRVGGGGEAADGCCQFCCFILSSCSGGGGGGVSVERIKVCHNIWLNL